MNRLIKDTWAPGLADMGIDNDELIYAAVIVGMFIGSRVGWC